MSSDGGGALQKAVSDEEEDQSSLAARSISPGAVDLLLSRNFRIEVPGAGSGPVADKILAAAMHAMKKVLHDAHREDRDAVAANIASCVVEAIMGSKALRLQSRPTEQAVAAMTKICEAYVRDDRPIPILIAASGSKLPSVGTRLDRCEWMFISTLMELQASVKLVHRPGLEIVIRLEDATVAVLFSDTPGVQTHIDQYCEDFERTVRLGFKGAADFIKIARETELMSMSKFMVESSRFGDLFARFFLARRTGDSGQRSKCAAELREAGWFSDVSVEMEARTRETYSNLYSHKSESWREKTMSLYFACILARRRLKGYGVDDLWNHGKLEISLVPPQPDAPKDAPRVYRRWLSSHADAAALPFWRCAAQAGGTFSPIEPGVPIAQHTVQLHQVKGSLKIPIVIIP